MTRTLTEEQEAFVARRPERGDLIHVEAVAGSGKTTTLVEYAKRHPDLRILYVVYNKDAQLSARERMPENAEPRTFHSLALETLRVWRAQHRMKAPTPRSYVDAKDVERTLKGHPQQAAINYFSEARHRRVAARLYKQYCEDTQRAPDDAYVRQQRDLLYEQDGDEKIFADADAHFYVDAIKLLKRAAQLGHSQVTFDACAKLMFLSPPQLDRYDVILVDEAQDFQAQYLSVVMAWRPLPLVFVGDRNQRIYGWQGSTSVFEVTTPTREYALTRSFRFSDAVAEVAHTVIRAPIVGGARTPSRVVVDAMPGVAPAMHLMGMRDVIYLHRSNLTLLKHAVRILELNTRFKVAIIGRGRQIVNDVKKLVEMRRARRWLYDKRVQEAVSSNDRQQQKLHEWIDKEPARVSRMMDLLCDHLVRQNAKADVYLGTVHASKGLEWDAVVLNDDLIPPRLDGMPENEYTHDVAVEVDEEKEEEDDKEDEEKEEEDVPVTRQRSCARSEAWRLVYVAATRARRLLVITPLLKRALALRERALLE